MFVKPTPLRRQHGMTLVEMLIAMAVLAIIAAIAFPMFQDAMRKSRRSEAMSALTQLMQAQERWRGNNATYYQGAVSELPGAPTNGLSANGHYSLSIADGSATATGYTALASAQSTSPQADDTTCHTLQVSIAAGTVVYGSALGDGTANTTDRCWVR